MADKNHVYTNGHHESVLQSHKWRTVENSAQFLVKYLKPDSFLLDAGCGPGNISAGVSELLPNGKVIGMDFSTAIIEQAKSEFTPSKYKNLEFQQGDIYHLDLADNTFDIIYTHQVIQHLMNPVDALKELRRVLKPGGIIAVREADNHAFTWYPQLPELDRWRNLYREVTQHNGAESNGGRFLKAWVMQAGLQVSDVSCTTWVFSNDRDRNWWGGLWSKRILESDFAKQALAYDLSNVAELEELSEAFLRWAKDPSGIWTIPNMEVIATKN